jgi:aspartate-semialdehyde dehydrogenase
MRLAIVGATGAVGHEILKVLAQSPLHYSELRLYASARSAGTTLRYQDRDLTVEEMPAGAIEADLILASAGGSISKTQAPAWVAGGAVVIDNSSAFRLENDVPLVIPEINGQVLDGRDWRKGGLIANPNCTTAIAAMALYPLHQAFGIKRAIISTYQSTSGAGAKGMQELLEQTRAVLDGGRASHSAFAHPIPFNLIPHIDSFMDNGYTKEEMKVVWKTRKIFAEPDLVISCTAVRIPTLRVHAEAITLELARPASAAAARALLAAAPGVRVVDNPLEKQYPMPLTASEQYDVEVGRIRESLVFEGGLDLFVCGDQLLKGAALNAVQIAEYLQTKQLI